jgi:hypothetical protein
MVVRPYHYAHGQKLELERQCADMLQVDITDQVRRPSQLSYCLSRRAMNCGDSALVTAPLTATPSRTNSTFRWWKNCSTSFMARRSSPSSIYGPATTRCGCTNDVHNTWFRTHESLFEFLVMHFSLSNTSTTFQPLMNKVLRPLLRRFILVFFYDILIFNSSWSEHIAASTSYSPSCRNTSSSSSDQSTRPVKGR